MTVNPHIIICDIDGVCVDADHRLPYLMSGDRESYIKAAVDDKPLTPGCVIYRKFLNDKNYKLLFVTSRKDVLNYRQVTLNQIRNFVSQEIEDWQLLMRPADSDFYTVPDAVLKPLLVEELGIKIEDIFLVFEDRDSTVKGWRDLGCIVYQTASWD